mmetsp:Transcript_98183/g.311446  ORF Transcript_98183/g.311446 Transcript_98183/m.311446 type:complete len:229 (+) Transcript_98183:607-1293(+)
MSTPTTLLRRAASTPEEDWPEGSSSSSHEPASGSGACAPPPAAGAAPLAVPVSSPPRVLKRSPAGPKLASAAAPCDQRLNNAATRSASRWPRACRNAGPCSARSLFAPRCAPINERELFPSRWSSASSASTTPPATAPPAPAGGGGARKRAAKASLTPAAMRSAPLVELASRARDGNTTRCRSATASASYLARSSWPRSRQACARSLAASPKLPGPSPSPCCRRTSAR